MKKKLFDIGGKIWKHKFLFGIAILVIGGAIYFGYNNGFETDSGDDVKTTTIKQDDIEIIVTGTGQVYAESQVDLKGVKAGDGIDVIEITVQNDQEVKKNDLIAVLDTTDPMKSVRNAKLGLEAVLINQKEVENEFDNETVEEKWKRQSQEISVQQKQASLSDAQNDLEDYYIRAPFNGIVTGLSVEVGDSVSQSDVIVSVITEAMHAEISLNEVDAVMVKKGNKVILTFDALSGVAMEGEISKIDTIGEVSQNVVSYNAEISFESISELLKPGMSVNAEIAVDSRENVLQVSNSAIKTDDDGSTYVQVLQTNASSINVDDSVQKFKIEKQTIKTGLTDDVVTQIVSGDISEGDVIVIKMSTSLNGESDEKEAAGLLDSVKMGGGKR
jgi:RND family efflux transporter MFP subunit